MSGQRVLLSAIKARQNELTLEEARRRLAQLEEDVKSRTKSNEAAMAVLIEKRKKAQLAIDQAQRRSIRWSCAPTMDGIIAVSENRETNFGFWGMAFADYREGDTRLAGRLVAEVLDMRADRVSANVPEIGARAARRGSDGDGHARLGRCAEAQART